MALEPGSRDSLPASEQDAVTCFERCPRESSVACHICVKSLNLWIPLGLEFSSSQSSFESAHIRAGRPSEGMSAAFPVRFGRRGAIGGSGGIVAVTLWNYLWQELGSQITPQSESARRSRYLLEWSFVNSQLFARNRRIPASLSYFESWTGLNFAPLLLLIRTTKEVRAERVPNRASGIWPVFNRLENCRESRVAPIPKSVSSWHTACRQTEISAA
jgi:hypothetical protein